MKIQAIESGSICFFHLTCWRSNQESSASDKETDLNESGQFMKLKESEVQPTTSAAEARGDSAKLLSLLALATGAVAMPQTSNADIVYVDLSATPEHIGPLADPSFVITLPGTARIGFNTHHRGNFSTTSTRWITGGQQAGYVKVLSQAFILQAANPGQVWSTFKNGKVVTDFATAAYATFYAGVPGSFSGKYYLFEFKDSTQANAMCYGWISVGLANRDNSSIDLAVNGWAYETSPGVMLGAGQVPEPTAPALLALGALVFGSKGLRKWRKNKVSGTT